MVTYPADIPWNVVYTSKDGKSTTKYSGYEFNVTRYYDWDYINRYWSTNYIWSTPPSKISPNTKYSISMESNGDLGSILISSLGLYTDAPNGWQFGYRGAGKNVAEYTAPTAPSTATEKRAICVELSCGASGTDTFNYAQYWYIYEWKATKTISIAASFSDSGLWIYNTGSAAWIKVGSANPENMIYSGSTLYADYGAYGLYKLDGSAWTQLSSATSEDMVVSGSTLYVDFGDSYGLYRLDGSAWTQLSKANPNKIAVSN